MKNKIIKSFFISILCMIIFVGCSVVPSSTPGTSPDSTLMDVLYRNRDKVEYPMWLEDAPSTQRIKVRFYVNPQLVDSENMIKEVKASKLKGESKIYQDRICVKYRSAPVKEILKKYGLEDQIEGGLLVYSPTTPYVEYPIIDLNILCEMIQDPDITKIYVEYRELENGEWVSAWIDVR